MGLSEPCDSILSENRILGLRMARKRNKSAGSVLGSLSCPDTDDGDGDDFNDHNLDDDDDDDDGDDDGGGDDDVMMI